MALPPQIASKDKEFSAESELGVRTQTVEWRESIYFIAAVTQICVTLICVTQICVTQRAFYSFQIQNAFLHQADILWRARPRRNFPFDSRICWGSLWRWEAHWSTCCCYNIYLRWDNWFSGEQFSALKPSLTYGQVASFNLYEQWTDSTIIYPPP